MFAIIFWIIVALIAYAFREQLIQIAVFIGAFMAIGALIFWILFDNASLGSTIGFWVAIFIGLKLVTQSMECRVFLHLRIRLLYFFRPRLVLEPSATYIV